MRYRPEIDGLRAIAVLPVLLFHAGFARFRGGFVGVDVFFVISGYLITGIIHSEIRDGSFSIARFYKRRARRILPILFFVSLACVPFALLWMLPDELAAFGKSLVAVDLFVSNFYFWSERGYFEAAAGLKPLLHTWSLAIEEQFYLFFPLFLVLCRRLDRKALLAVLALSAAASLGLAQWASGAHPYAGFYLLPSRAWELAAGAILAISAGSGARAAPWLAQIASAVGLGLILGAVLLLDETFHFPGAWALLPVVGTTLVIAYAGPGTIVGKVLGWRPIVGIGLISYSLYLWHQPLFVFYRMRTFGEVGTLGYLLLILLALLLAYLSWRLVEVPFRFRWLSGGRPLLLSGALASTLMIALGATIAVTTPQEQVARDVAPGGCHSLDGPTEQKCPLARLLPDTGTIVLWGDSFADMIAVALSGALQPYPVSFLPIVYPSCPSLLGTLRNEDYRMGDGFGRNCAAFVESAKERLAALRPDVVVLTSNYLWYSGARNPYDGLPILSDRDDAGMSGRKVVLASLLRTARYLRSIGARIVLIPPYPQVEDFVGRRRQHERFGGSRRLFDLDRRTALGLRDDIVSTFADAGVEFAEVDIGRLLCLNGAEACSALAADGEPLLFDGAHASSSLSRMIAGRIVEVMTEEGWLPETPAPQRQLGDDKLSPASSLQSVGR